MPRLPLAAVALAAVLGTLTGAARPVAAQPPAATPLPPELQSVPGDAAVFSHTDFERVWASKLGETFRKVSAREIDQGLKLVKDTAGITPADVKSVTVVIPKITTDGEPPVRIAVRTKKPYDRAGIVAYVKKQLEKEKDPLEELPGNKYLVNKRILLDMSDPTLFRFESQYDKAKANPPPPADGPVTPAVKLAAAGTPFVLAVAFGNLPDEIRQENVPAEVRPFQPFFHTDAAVLTGEFVGGDLVLRASFKAATRAKAVEAEKSLGALKVLIESGLTFGAQQLEKDKSDKRLVEFVKAVHAGVKAARITHEDNTPAARLVLKADIDYAPFLEMAFGSVGGAASRAQSSNNLKQIGLALYNYESANGAFPPAALVGKRGKQLLSWRVTILPYIEQEGLYKKFKLDEAWDSPHNKKVLDEHPMPPVYVLPGVSKPGDKTTYYQTFVGNGAFFDVLQGPRVRDVRDGTSNTLMLATARKAVPWTQPADIEFDPKTDPRGLLLFVNGTTMIGMADGSVRAFAEKASADTLKAIITRAGGEPVGANDF